MQTRSPASHLHVAPSSHLAGEDAPATHHRRSPASLLVAPRIRSAPAAAEFGAFSAGCFPSLQPNLASFPAIGIKKPTLSRRFSIKFRPLRWSPNKIEGSVARADPEVDTSKDQL